MSKFVVGAIAAAVLAAAAAGDKDAARLEMKKLEGTWQLVSALKDGKAAPEETVKKIRVLIKGGKHTVYFGEDTVVKEVPFTVDPKKDPKTAVDTLPDGKVIRSICKLDGDTLTSCVAEAGKAAPQKFDSAPGSGHTLRVFKRVKP